MVKNEIEKIDRLLDQEVEHVQMLLKVRKGLGHSLIKNDLVFLYNEMEALSYIIKLWLIKDLESVTDEPKEFLTNIRKQFWVVISLLNDKKFIDKDQSTVHPRIQYYHRLGQAI